MTTDRQTGRPQCCPAAALLAISLVAGVLYFIVRSAGFAPAQAQAENSIEISSRYAKTHPHKVLLVHSYHRGYPWVDTITRGIHMALEGHGARLEAFYMDTKRHTDEIWKRQSGDAAKEVVTQWQPEVIVAVDDNAQQYFAKDYADQDGPPIVFCGVNAALASYGYPTSNVTGILERPHFKEDLEMVRRLLPHACRVAIITDDSPTSSGAIEYMTDPPAPWCIVSCEQPRTFDQWQSAVQHAQSQADVIAVYTYHTVKQAGRQISVEPTEVMTWTVQTSQLPIIGFFPFAVDDGALCGYMESGMEHGLEVGRMVSEILAGRAPSSIPVTTALKGQAMVNVATARNLGIDIPRDFLSDGVLVVGE